MKKKQKETQDISVSYTHLDVYKRQGFFSEFFEMMNMMGAELFDLPWTQALQLSRILADQDRTVLQPCAFDVSPVSYTHLDVYKRQPYQSCGSDGSGSIFSPRKQMSPSAKSASTFSGVL